MKMFMFIFKPMLCMCTVHCVLCIFSQAPSLPCHYWFYTHNTILVLCWCLNFGLRVIYSPVICCSSNCSRVWQTDWKYIIQTEAAEQHLYMHSGRWMMCKQKIQIPPKGKFIVHNSGKIWWRYEVWTWLIPKALDKWLRCLLECGDVQVCCGSVRQAGWSWNNDLPSLVSSWEN